MIKRTTASKERIALNIARERQRGTVVFGVGYPFFINEWKWAVDLCQFFVDDLHSAKVDRWKRIYIIKDYQSIADDRRYLAVIFSNNRQNIVEKIKHFYNITFLNLSTEQEISTNIHEIERASLLTVKANSLENLAVDGSINADGRCIVDIRSRSKLSIQSLSLSENSSLVYTSKNETEMDSLILKDNVRLFIGVDTQVNFCNCRVGKNTNINIYSGEVDFENVYIGDNCNIHVYDGLHIGFGSLISWNVSILDGDGHSLWSDKKWNKPRRICIGERVWVGNGATILKGVTIGDGCVIGAASVVTSDIPPYSLAVGNPATIIRRGIVWDYGYKV